MSTPIRIVNAAAPIRICDNGGWTDTWFAQHGTIFNVAASPYAEVQLRVYDRADRPPVTLHAENYGDSYPISLTGAWDRHPLLEASIRFMGVPNDLSLEINVYSQVPPGASTGTSAAVTVALLGALDALTPGRLTAHQIAAAAQSIETDMLNQQCGIQDQLCSAYGGINLIEMSAYPHATVTPIHLSDSIWHELDRRLILIYLGRSHASSEMHHRVIRDLEDAGADDPRLAALRATAVPSRDALLAGDLPALGRAMIANTHAQANLHPDLISADAHHVIEIASAHQALGWKVNGAGGEGGSLTLLAGDDPSRQRALIRDLLTANPAFQIIPIHLSRDGLRVWDSPLPS